MSHRIFTILSLLLSYVSVKVALPTDTLNRTIDLAQVVVTGTRTPKLLANTPVLTSEIGRAHV